MEGGSVRRQKTSKGTDSGEDTHQAELVLFGVARECEELGVVVELGGGDGSRQIRYRLERFRALSGSGAKRVATIYVDDARFRPGRVINTVSKRAMMWHLPYSEIAA